MLRDSALACVDGHGGYGAWGRDTNLDSIDGMYRIEVSTGGSRVTGGLPCNELSSCGGEVFVVRSHGVRQPYQYATGITGTY